ncbi:UPF0489 family protein [Candidatus Omnitrophota bacterium]
MANYKDINKISLIEDHNEALTIWRKKRFRNLDLVHIDAHIDFSFPAERPIKLIFEAAKGIKELKRDLENAIARKISCGNYIYAAIKEGIVKDFYWVIPGSVKEFKESLKDIKRLLKNLSSRDPYRQKQRTSLKIGNGIISSRILGKRMIICILEKLPLLKNKVLVDIDTDFLVIDSLKNVFNSAMIEKRRPWILPDRLSDILVKKIKRPISITIAYSINGGYTPLKYKHLGDELANALCGRGLEDRYAYRRNLQAAEYFGLFESTRKKEYYQKAIKLNPSYRVADNNYGLRYLSIGKLAKAEKEFRKIAEIDPTNPDPLISLGDILLQRKDYKNAQELFRRALEKKGDLLRPLFGLAHAKFYLKEYQEAKRLLKKYQSKEPVEPLSHYFLGCIYEKEGNFKKAIAQYQYAIKFGLNNIDVIHRLLRIALRLKVRDGIIKLAVLKYREFKEVFDRAGRSSVKKGKRPAFLVITEKKMASLERRLREAKIPYR